MGFRPGTMAYRKLLQDSVTNPTLADGATFYLNGMGDEEGLTGSYEQLAVQVEGITTATVVFEATVDGTVWYSIGLYTPANHTTVATQAVADGLWILRHTKGLTAFRARITVNTTGVIIVTAQAA